MTTVYTAADFPPVDLTLLKYGSNKEAAVIMRSALKRLEADRKEELANGSNAYYGYVCDAILDVAEYHLGDELRARIHTGIEERYGVLDWLQVRRPGLFREMIKSDDNVDWFERHTANPNTVDFADTFEFCEILDPEMVTQYRKDWVEYMIAELSK